jgi:GNAT superfamily N-acetyltransferase
MSLAELAAEGLCLLANLDDAPIGCLFCSPREDALYVGKLAVDPDHQGEGIGRALLDAAENAARAASLPALELQTRVEMTENHAAFTAMGFVLAGETAHPGYDRPTSITMRREL